jgi:hypothetical protein
MTAYHRFVSTQARNDPRLCECGSRHYAYSRQEHAPVYGRVSLCIVPDAHEQPIAHEPRAETAPVAVVPVDDSRTVYGADVALWSFWAMVGGTFALMLVLIAIGQV